MLSIGGFSPCDADKNVIMQVQREGSAAGPTLEVGCAVKRLKHCVRVSIRQWHMLKKKSSDKQNKILIYP